MDDKVPPIGSLLDEMSRIIREMEATSAPVEAYMNPVDYHKLRRKLCENEPVVTVSAEPGYTEKLLFGGLRITPVAGIPPGKVKARMTDGSLVDL